MSESYADVMSRFLEDAGVPKAREEVERFIKDNPGIEQDLTPEEAAKEWLAGSADVIGWRDPAQYGAS